MSILTACYDLARSPPTYDFVSFLLFVECERRRRGIDQVKVVFLPGPDGGFRRDRLWPHSVKERDALLRDLVMPMCGLLPGCVGATRAEIHPDSGPSIGSGEAHYGLKVFVDAMREIGPILRAPSIMPRERLVTITLRECEHWPERNSNIKEWVVAAHTIKDMGFEVVFVRDTLHADKPIGDLCIDPAASRDVFVRAALYSQAYCNLSVSNGPAWLAMALGVPLIMFRPVDDKSGNRCARSEYFQSCGIPRGGQVPGAGPMQKLVWAPDDCDQIVMAFEKIW